MMKNKAISILLALLLYLFLAIAFSAGKLDLEACGKSYPIDYVIYTNLFCEIKEQAK